MSEDYADLIGDIDLAEVEDMAARAEESAERYAKAARNVGGPVETRLADALTDIAAAVRKVDGDNTSNRALIERVGASLAMVDGSSRELAERALSVESAVRERTRGAVLEALAEDGSRFERVSELADDAMAALEALNERAEGRYAAAVEESCKRLSRATWLAVAAILTAATAGVVAAALSTYWLTTANPAVQAFVAENGVFALLAIVGAAAAVVWLVWCAATRKK